MPPVNLAYSARNVCSRTNIACCVFSTVEAMAQGPFDKPDSLKFGRPRVNDRMHMRLLVVRGFRNTYSTFRWNPPKISSEWRRSGSHRVETRTVQHRTLILV
jgi:hypothetical protein